MSKREAQLKSAIMKLVRADGFLDFQLLTAGAPDRSLSKHGRTTHWEFKHGTPNFKSSGIQELTCVRLAEQGHCRYVIWQETEDGSEQSTLIAHPLAVKNRRGWWVVPEVSTKGYDHHWLLQQIRLEHP